MENQGRGTQCIVEQVGKRWRVIVIREGGKETVYWFNSREGAYAFAEAEEWSSRQG